MHFYAQIVSSLPKSLALILLLFTILFLEICCSTLKNRNFTKLLWDLFLLFQLGSLCFHLQIDFSNYCVMNSMNSTCLYLPSAHAHVTWITWALLKSFMLQGGVSGFYKCQFRRPVVQPCLQRISPPCRLV